MTHRIAVLVSGTGRHLENLTRLSRGDPELVDPDVADPAVFDAEVVLVVSSRPGVKALERAARFDLPAVVFEPSTAEPAEEYGARIFEAIRASGADTVVLAGFLRKLWVPDDYAGRVLNIHPSLLPAFGGKGFYGDRVHRAVLEQGAPVTGCTVHLVDEIYDNGRVLLQRECPVLAGDTPDTLAQRVFDLELRALPDALRILWSSEERHGAAEPPH